MSAEDNQASQLLSVEEVCEVLGMGKSWVYRKIRSGDIPSVKLGGSIKVDRADLDRYLKNHQRSKPREE
jgi:excisionase family DNA binding protein